MMDLQTRLLPFGFDEGATFSEDRKYRYRLWRSWGDRERRCVFVGLNPSKADEHGDDLTLTKCMGFARKWGFQAIDMMNLFAIVSTDPLGLAKTGDPVGPDTDAFLREACKGARRIVCCWGTVHPTLRPTVSARVVAAQALLAVYGAQAELGFLGRTKDGSPRHPSRLGYAAEFERGWP